MEIRNIAWLFAVATAIWFALMARRAERNMLLWALAGGSMGLTVSTMVMGLCQASLIPLSVEESAHSRLSAVLGAAAAVGFLGLILTLGLQKWPARLSKG